MQGNGRGPGDSWVASFPEELCAALHRHSGSEAGTDVRVAGDGPYTDLRPARGSGGHRRARRATVQETEPGLQLRASRPHLRPQPLREGPAWLARPTRAPLPGAPNLPTEWFPDVRGWSGGSPCRAPSAGATGSLSAVGSGGGRPGRRQAGGRPCPPPATWGPPAWGSSTGKGPAEFLPDEVFVQEINTREAGALLCPTLTPSHPHPCVQQGGPFPHASGSPGGPSAVATPLPPLGGRPDPSYLHPQAAADQGARAEVTAWDVLRPA